MSLIKPKTALLALGIAAFFPATEAAAGPGAFPSPGNRERGGILSDCGSRLSPDDVRRSLELERSGAHRPPPAREAGPRHVRTAVHIVRTTEGLGGMTIAELQAALAKANQDFAPAGIVFDVVDPIDYIDSDFFYYDVDTREEIDSLRAVNPVEHAMNLYFTENMPFCGISSFSWQAVQGIVLVNACVVTDWNPSTFTHEIGHYFDLIHTHETAYGEECVDGSNCETAGDLLCDTPADPRLDRCGPGGNEYCVDSNCAYTGDFIDACHGDPYEPSAENMMSYSRPLCRTAFTPDQCLRAEATLRNIRPDHILEPVEVRGPNDGETRGRSRLLVGPAPNPATGRIAYSIDLPAGAPVKVRVYDLSGRRVANLIDERLSPGAHRFDWEPRADLPSGIYSLVLDAGEARESRRVVLVR